MPADEGCCRGRPGSDPGAENHVAPEIGYASGAREGQVMVSRLPEQDGECPARPELDVAAFPQGAQVVIHLVGRRDGEVFQVAVVGCRDDELAAAAGFEDAADEQYECPRLVEVFDDLHRNHCFEGNAAQFGREFARGYITDEKPLRISPPLIRLAIAMPCSDASMP